VFPKRAPHPSERRTRPTKTTARRQHEMAQQRKAQRPYTEGDVQLAIFDLQNQRIRSIQRAESIYKVPNRTIRRRRDGTRARRDYEPNSKRLTKLEEEVILDYILDLSLRGVPPTRALVRDMADRLLRERGGKPVGKHWVDNFVKRTPELKKRWSRPYDRQRAACEDPALILPWFELVQSVKAKYGILDEDTWNFDETGFLMGKITS
jgi:hypothetical protein